MNRVVSLPGKLNPDHYIPRHTRYITICSGRDGVGKTSIAVNLGIVLARMGNRVLLIDADSGVANAPAMLGLASEKTLADVVIGEAQLVDTIVRGPAGLNVLYGGRHIAPLTAEPALQRRLAHDFQNTETRFDYTLVDTTAGADADLTAYLDATDDLLLVITPDPGSLSDTFAMLNKLVQRNRRHRLHLVVNQSPNVANANDTSQRFSATVRKYIGLDITCAGAIHRNEAIRNAFTLQHPVALYPYSDPSCKAFFQLAQNLRDHLKPCDDNRGLGSLLAASIVEEPDSNDNVVNAQAFFNSGIRDAKAAEELSPLPVIAEEPALREPTNTDTDTDEISSVLHATDITAEYAPAHHDRSRHQFARLATVIEDLTRSGDLTEHEFEAVIVALTEVAQQHFPHSSLLNRQPADEPTLGTVDTIDSADAALDPFEKSLLETLKQNRTAGKPLEQLLSEFIASKRSRH